MRRRNIKYIGVLMLVTGCAKAGTDAVLAVATSFFDHLDAHEWAEAAALVSDSAVSVFYQRHVQYRLTEVPGSRNLTPEALQAAYPEMPREVAEYHARRVNAAPVLDDGWLVFDFAGVTTQAELRALTPRETLARYFEAADPAYRVSLPVSLPIFELSPDSTERLGPLRRVRQVIGAISDGTDGAYTVYREEWLHSGGSVVRGQAGLMEWRRIDGGWRIVHANLLEDRPWVGRGSLGVEAIPDVKTIPTR